VAWVSMHGGFLAELLFVESGMYNVYRKGSKHKITLYIPRRDESTVAVGSIT